MQEYVKSSSSFGKKVAIAALPIAFGSTLKKAYGGTQATITDVLNYALTLEYLENEFYADGNNAPSLIPSDRKAIFAQIGKHEAPHVAFLKATITSLGSPPVSKPTFNFTAKGAFPDALTNYQTKFQDLIFSNRLR